MAKKISPKQTTTKKHVARRQREARQTRILLIIVIVIGVIILGLLGYGIVDQLIIKPRIPVAEVDATVIRLKEFQIQVQYARAQSLNQLYQNYMYGQQFGEYGASFLDSARLIAMNLSDTVGFGRGVLDEMIDWVLIRKAAKEHGITVSEEEIENTLQQAFGFFPEGTLTPTTTATAIATPTLSETQRALVTLTNTPTAADLSSEELELFTSPGG
ncbi:MAG: SurA N-terminal domain-containing protein [Brevefilum sp.]